MEIGTKYGKLRGVAGEHAWVYKGVPYAKPPVEKRRFRAPEKLEPWEGVFAADAFPPMAIQAPQEKGSFYEKEFYQDPAFMPQASEDCLYLNLWVPKEKREEPFPVAVWYHGGAFIGGFCSEIEFDGEAYAKEGVILVSVGYRLGMLGFLSHPALTERDGHSGNYGLLDQIAALDWVRENISAFGGDPNQLTVMGQSAGAMSVRNLCASPLAKGKIQRAIIQSAGGYKSPLGGMLPAMETMSKAYADALSAQGLSLEDLYAKPAEEILSLQISLWPVLAQATGCMIPYCPQVDGYSLPKGFDGEIEEGGLPAIPYLIGSNEKDMAQDDAGDGIGQMHKSNMAFGEMQSEKSNVYVYYFKHNLPGDDAGSFHSAELWYMFGTWKRCWRPFTEADGKLSEEMLAAWIGFIRNGDPGWEAYTAAQPTVKEFGGV